MLEEAKVSRKRNATLYVALEQVALGPQLHISDGASSRRVRNWPHALKAEHHDKGHALLNMTHIEMVERVADQICLELDNE